MGDGVLYETLPLALAPPPAFVIKAAHESTKGRVSMVTVAPRVRRPNISLFIYFYCEIKNIHVANCRAPTASKAHRGKLRLDWTGAGVI